MFSKGNKNLFPEIFWSDNNERSVWRNAAPGYLLPLQFHDADVEQLSCRSGWYNRKMRSCLKIKFHNKKTGSIRDLKKYSVIL